VALRPPEGHFEAQSLWQQVEAHSQRTRVEAHQPVLDSPEDFPQFLHAVADVLQVAGHKEEIYKLRKAEEQEYVRLDDVDGLLSCKLDQAVILTGTGRRAEARGLYEALREFCISQGRKALLQKVLLNLSIIVHKQGEMGTALKMLHEQADLCRALKRYDDLGGSLHNQALIWMARGNREKTEQLLDESMELAQETANRASESIVLGTKGVVAMGLEEFDEAQYLLEKQETILRNLGDSSSLPVCLINQGKIELRRRALPAAEALADEALDLARRHSDRRGEECARPRWA